MPHTEHALISDFNEALLTELRHRGFTVSKAYLGDFGYTTEDQTDLVCDAINDLMHETPDWTPIIWDQLEPRTQCELMLLAADSDTFMEKGRLPSNFGHEERINCILGLCDGCVLCDHKQTRRPLDPSPNVAPDAQHPLRVTVSAPTPAR